MSSFRDVAARLGEVLTATEQARRLLNTATDRLDEAHTIFHDTLSGSSSFDVRQVSDRCRYALEDIDEQREALGRADEAVRACRAGLVGDPAAPGAPTGTPATSNRPSAPDTPPLPVTLPPERVDQLRAELPPPVVLGVGRWTHGRWVDHDGNVTAIVSGHDEQADEAERFFREDLGSRRIPRVTKDVEVKVAAHMRKHGIRSTSLVINNVPCPAH